MTVYQVQYSSLMAHGRDTGKVIQMISLPVEARSERAAIAYIKASREGSFDHVATQIIDGAA